MNKIVIIYRLIDWIHDFLLLLLKYIILLEFESQL